MTGQYSDDSTIVVFRQYRMVGSNLVLVRSLVLPGSLYFVKESQNRCIPIDSVIFGLWLGNIRMIKPLSYSDNTEWRDSNLVLLRSLVLPGRLYFVKESQNRCIPIDSVIFGLWLGNIRMIQPLSYSDNTECRDSNLVLVRSLVLPGSLYFVKESQNVVSQ